MYVKFLLSYSHISDTFSDLVSFQEQSCNLYYNWSSFCKHTVQTHKRKRRNRFVVKERLWWSQLDGVTTFEQRFSPLPMPPHVLSDFVVSPPGLWLKCNRLLRLGRPVGAVTLSRWEWWWNKRWIWGARRGLKPNFYQLPRPWASSPCNEKRTW